MVPVFVWSCRPASPGRAADAPAGASLTPTTGATSVETGATTPTTATASAREAGAAGEAGCLRVLLSSREQKGVSFSVSTPGLALVPDLAPGPGPEDAATALTPAPAAAATAGTSPVAPLLPVNEGLTH